MSTALDHAIALRGKLHEIPEPSGCEVQTKQLLMRDLKDICEIQDCGPWFYAAHREEDAACSICFRADMDAVSGGDGTVFHGCGHDGHMSVVAALARELAPAIRVNAVAPGAVLQEDGMPVAALERLSAFNPLKAHGSPEGLAACVRFLLECDFITGQTIHYDGGYWMRDDKTTANWHSLMEGRG